MPVRSLRPTGIPRAGTRWGFAVSVAVMVVFVAQTAAPSPLYPQYQRVWALTALELSGVFAIYVAGLLVVLISAGSVSDYLGRKPVIIVAGGLAVVALLLLAAATEPWMMVVARVLQGASIGLVSGAAGAALLEFHLPGRLRLSAGLNGALPPLAMALGALTSAALSLVVPAPRRTIYLVFAVAVIICTVLVFTIQERGPRRGGAIPSLKPTLALPMRTRPVFIAVLGALCSGWALAGLYVGDAAAITSTVLHLRSPLAAGCAILAVQGAAAISGMAAGGFKPQRAVLYGLVALIVGVVVTFVALVWASPLLFFSASIVAGAGYGAAFQTSLRLILAETPESHRSGALSAVYTVSFLSFGVPSVLAGLLTPVLGFLPTADLYLALIVLLALTAIVTQVRSPSASHAEEGASVDEAVEDAAP